MHFLASLAALLVATTAGAHAKCYNSGQQWIPSFAEGDIREAVNAFAKGGMTWAHGEEYTYTVFHPNNNGCVKFKLQNISALDRTIYEAEAYEGFSKEYTGCSRGGDSSYDHWRFVADPTAENECRRG
ncbi:hypothetical protein DFH06DRAFT_1129839 [Mycena polygramma]|nr:hypothetical protein DFH06DRAFT_1129839 [Mycena polygramma]